MRAGRGCGRLEGARLDLNCLNAMTKRFDRTAASRRTRKRDLRSASEEKPTGEIEKKKSCVARVCASRERETVRSPSRLLRALQWRHVFVLVVRVRGVHEVVLPVFAHRLQGGQVERLGAIGFILLILVHPLVEIGFDVRVFFLRAQQTRPVRTGVLRGWERRPSPKRRSFPDAGMGFGERGNRRTRQTR